MMKELIIKSLFDDNYIHPSLIYRLLKDNKLDYYIKYLEKNKYYIEYNNQKIENYKNFIMALDNFIDYLDCSLNINHSLIKNILDLIFESQKNNVFLTKNYIKSNQSISKITKEYKKIILEPFRKNLIFIINSNDELKKLFNSFKINLKNDKILFNFLIDCCDIRKNHQYILFDDYNEYINSNSVFYYYMWKILFQKLTKNYTKNELA